MNTKLNNRYTKLLVGVVASILVVSFSAPAMAVEDYASHTGDKIGRGLVNIGTGWLEFPKQIYVISKEDNVFTGFTYGAAKGVADSVVRTGAGVYETGTFFIPVPGDYEPVKEPEYVWDDLE